MDKILVVEDDKTVYSGIKKLLELQHYSVVIAQNGMEALEKIDESFSLVIMDIMMPQLDGIETCRRMRERHSVPILFLSAKSEELDKLEGLEVGGDDYMTKPFSNMELIPKIFNVYHNSILCIICKNLIPHHLVYHLNRIYPVRIFH